MWGNHVLGSAIPYEHDENLVDDSVYKQFGGFRVASVLTSVASIERLFGEAMSWARPLLQDMMKILFLTASTCSLVVPT